ncbi:Serine/threonine-protein phosphatase 7 long form homolog [Linum grandiflorum]
MRAGRGKGLMSTRLDNRVNITASARRDIPENELRKKRKKKPPIVYSEPEIHPDITIPRPSNVMHDRVVSDEDETDMGYEEPLQGDPHQVGTGSSHTSELMDTPVIHTRRGVASFVQSSGLYHLGTCMTAPLDTPLLQAFIERWQPDTNTFHMPFGEMTVTLHDVWYILRVPICGTPLLADPDISSADTIASFLGYKNSEQLKGPIGLKEGSKVPWMKSGAVHVRGLIARAASMDDADAAKMWLFCLLGSSLFVDKTSDRVRSWIHEYFPHTRKSVAQPEPQREGEPLCGRWASTDAIASGPDGRDKRLAYYRRLLDSLESEDVTWLPFGPDPAERVPDRTFDMETDSTFRGVIRFGDIAEHYDPMRVLRQFGYVQDVPDEVPWPSECTRGCLSPYVVTWATSHDGAWSSRGNRRYISVMYRRCSEEEDVAPGYMQWYMDRTHPRILRTIAERVDCPPELLAFRILDGLHPMLADPGGLPAETMEELCTRVHELYVDFRRQRLARRFYRDEDDDDE